MQTLFNQTLGSDTASIDTGTISTSYDQLWLLILMRTTEAVVNSSGLITFNGDSSAIYDIEILTGNDATASSAATNAGTSLALRAPGSSVAANAFAAHSFWLPAYSQTTAHKAGVGHGGWAEATAANCRMTGYGFRYRTTTAISRITLTAGSGNLLTGSRLTVLAI